MAKSEYDLIAEVADLLTNAVRRGPLLRRSTTVTLTDRSARATAAALTSIVGKPEDRVRPADACKNWTGTCEKTCDACRDTYRDEQMARQAKFERECRAYNVGSDHDASTTAVIDEANLGLPWSYIKRPFPWMGFSIRDASGQQRAIASSKEAAEIIVNSVSAPSNKGNRR